MIFEGDNLVPRYPLGMVVAEECGEGGKGVPIAFVRARLSASAWRTQNFLIPGITTLT
jgi:hypothetical protein